MNDEIMDSKQIQKALKRLSSEIIEAYEDFDSVVIVGIRTRGYYLAERLKKLIEESEDISLTSGAIDITFYRDDLSIKFSHPAVESTDIPVSLEAKKVILVDDVLYTGRTIRAAMEVIFDFGRPAEIKVVSLIDRPARRELPILSNFTGKSINLHSKDNVKLCLEEIDGQDKVYIQK